MILRCTQRLLKGVGLPIVADPPTPEAALGEWYANAVALPFTGRWVVMYTSASTLLTVVAPGRAVRTTLPAFRERLPLLLRRLGLPDEWVDAQARAVEEVIIARTNNRRVLGSMDDLANLVWFIAAEHRAFQTFDLDEVEMALSQNRLGMIDGLPAEAVAKLARGEPAA